MSLLPQNKKSAEEIAKLRESLGIVGPPPVEEVLPVAAPVPESALKPKIQESPTPTAQLPEIAKVDEMAPLPIPEVHEPKPVRSLKRSERIPVLPVEDEAADKAAVILETKPLPAPLPVAHVPKMVRSLRKSEQVPLAPVPAPAPDSSLPIHRHSEKEIHEIRRQEMLAMQTAAGHLKSLTAHPALVIPGYLFVIAGAVGFYFYDLEKTVIAGCVAVALLIATFIFFRKPLSVHHAAFITVAALFVVVFGALHYFPQLQHGT